MPEKAQFVCVEYVWLDAKQVPRSKTKCITGKSEISLKECSDWNFDGSSTGQAPGTDSEVILKPRVLYPDPIRGAPHVMVLCDCYTPKGTPIKTNTRAIASDVFASNPGEIPWFGIEQEYVLFKDGAPLGWPAKGPAHSIAGYASTLQMTGPQGPFYCSAGYDVAFGREIVDEHLLLCLKMGLKVSGTNAEVMCGQWEFQVGPCTGIEAGDQHVMARYLLARVGEKHGVSVSYEPKPVDGVNGSGAHTNFSTKKMREDKNGLKHYILPAIEKLGKRHREHIFNYGEDNFRRLTGHHETQSMHKFSWGVANRGASVRVGNDTAQKGYGYFEDRRPAANMDPYVVTGMIFDTCCCNAKFADRWAKAPKDPFAFRSGLAHRSGYDSEGSETGSEHSESSRRGSRSVALKKIASGSKKSGCAAIM